MRNEAPARKSGRRDLAKVAGAGPVVILACMLAGSVAQAGPGELSLLAGMTSGDYGSDMDADTQALTARYIVGDAWTFRAELAWLRARSAPGLLQSAYGPWRLGRGQSADAGTGTGEQGGGGNGPGNSGGRGGPGPSADEWNTGVGDLFAAVTRTLTGGGAKLFRLDAGAQVKAPLADEDDHLGTGEWDARAGLAGEYRFWSLTAFGGAGWNRLGDPAGVDLEDVIDVYCGLEGLAFGERVVVSGWIDGHQELVDGTGDAALVGLEVRGVRRNRWRAAVTAGLGPSAQDLGFIVGRSFAFGGSGSTYREMLR